MKKPEPEKQEENKNERKPICHKDIVLSDYVEKNQEQMYSKLSEAQFY